MAEPVIVIGAGIGGLSAAIRLAAAGEPVIVLEQNQHVGGKMGHWSADGFYWDTGPSVITMRHVLEDLFTAAGRDMRDYIELLPVEPLTRYFYSDGTVLDATRDLPAMLAQIEQLNPQDVEGYLAYLAYAARLNRITGPPFIYGDPPSWRSLLQFSPLDALRIDAWRSMDSIIRQHVESPHLRQLLGRFATYVGGSPYRAPATLNVIAHVELNGGIWYPRGGIYRIAEGFARLATELGVEIRTSCGVEQILINDYHVQGVRLADGEELVASRVIANVDVATVYEKLLPAAFVEPRRLQRLRQQEPSCSGFVLLLGVKGLHTQMAQHNIFFSSDYRREFEEIFDLGVPPSEPTIYVTSTAKVDADHAPPGHENWFVLVNAPPLGERFDWATQAEAYGRRVLEQLATVHHVDVRDQIVYQRVLTPLDLERLTGARRGALYGASSNNMLTAFQRPNNRAADIGGLYFVGGTTHPGGGVPMVTLSGAVAARMLLADQH